VPLDDLLADRQPEPSAAVLSLGVQPLEDHEDALRILWLDTNAVVANAEEPFISLTLGRDVDARRVGAPVFQRVADQVLEELPQLDRVAAHGRQISACYAGCLFLQR
jgi:hypothetical protein